MIHRIRIVCNDPFHEKEVVVETFVRRDALDSWRPRGPNTYDRRGAYGSSPSASTTLLVDDRLATVDDDRPGVWIRARYPLSCTCGLNPVVRAENLNPILNPLAEHDVSSFELSRLARMLS